MNTRLYIVISISSPVFYCTIILHMRGEKGFVSFPRPFCPISLSPIPANLHSTTSYQNSQPTKKFNFNYVHNHSSTATMSVQTKATIASFGGKLLKLSHNASTTNCEMAFNLYLPPQTTTNPLHEAPLLIYLAGLTCTGDNGAEKGFFQHAASEKGIAVLYPDTSPRMAARPNRLHRSSKNRLWDLIIIHSQEASRSKAKTTRTISAAGRASTSTRQSPLGARNTECTATSRRSCRGPSSKTSSRWTRTVLVSSATAWVVMAP